MSDQRFIISAEQQKLISNALRIQIIHLLKDEALTAKQVATKLNKSPGSIHYHIQLLYEGDLLELVETKEKRGIIEKYYKAKSVSFSVKKEEIKGLAQLGSHLFLSDEEYLQLLWEVEQLFLRWESKTARQTNSEQEYRLSFRMKRDEEDGGM
ncbi:winged helix-turn-helix domain-containing protein [Bacillus sp. DX4.1]|uniref:ArsR/SmtB family transcription factor n=1 Tax=Bacillus sp. DX4.1 TaxID=3055867 RepID=UPI0025A13777|nr:winged helix-turn-helix domain-containing protein [Bacillus sp. DX4.1]MDM5187942.1 winged helix-turn-helix domain-containing protein [Bacillus sp. DX4.1]